MKKYVLTFFLLFAISIINAQEAILPAGGDGSAIEGTFSYSIGQILFSFNSSNEWFETQGVQQNILVYELSEPNLIGISLKAITYPNPTTDHIILRVDNSTIEDMNYVIYDYLGRSIRRDLIYNQSTKISLKYLKSGVYVLKLNYKNSEVKIFKIIKN